jgi:hypothetical protein
MADTSIGSPLWRIFIQNGPPLFVDDDDLCDIHMDIMAEYTHTVKPGLSYTLEGYYGCVYGIKDADILRICSSFEA